MERTQDDLAARLRVGQDTVSRIEPRSDILLSTLRRYVEAMGGELELIARFPNRAPLIIDPIAAKARQLPKHGAQLARDRSLWLVDGRLANGRRRVPGAAQEAQDLDYEPAGVEPIDGGRLAFDGARL